LPEPALPASFLPFASLLSGEAGELLQLDKPLWLTQAPCRLELIGGLVEGPGTSTLTLPLSRSVYCAIQNREDRKIRIRSVLPSRWGGSQLWEGDVDVLYTKKGPPRSLAVLSQVFEEEKSQWMLRVIAAMLGLRRTRQLNTPKVGFDMVIWSRVPEGLGFGERAAFGVAAALAFKASTGLAKKRVDGVQVARAVIQGAREVLGEEIPMSDALTSALGRRDCALAIEHGIDLDMQWIPVPPQCSFAAVDLGYQHEVGPVPRDQVRVSTEMALAHLNAALKKEKQQLFGSWGQMPPNEFEEGLRGHVPASQSGADWLKIFKRRKEHADLAALVDPDSSYRMRANSEHLVRESNRVRRLVSNINEYSRTLRETFLGEGGRCLQSSHRSLQEKCGISHSVADSFVQAFQEAGRQEGLFGTRLTLGGTCNVLVALVHQSARQQLRDLVDDFVASNEHCEGGQVIIGSQDGGVLRGWWEGVLQPVDSPEGDSGGDGGEAGDGAIPIIQANRERAEARKRAQEAKSGGGKPAAAKAEKAPAEKAPAKKAAKKAPAKKTAKKGSKVAGKKTGTRKKSGG
jgi:galactokinase